MSTAKAYLPAGSRSILSSHLNKPQSLTRQALVLLRDLWWQSHQEAAVVRGREHLFYRMDLSEPLARKPLRHGRFIIARNARDVRSHFSLWRRHFGEIEAMKTALKVLSGSQVFFGTLLGRELVQMGWATRGFCRYYRLEEEAIVLESLWTAPAHRGKGLAPAALRETISKLSKSGSRRFYIDTTPKNLASQRMIAKAGFTRIPPREAEKLRAA
jgi:GNAT superfamily N-acetyltransferase